MEFPHDLPIVNVCIVADPTKCPPNHILIDKTFDKADADLWKDGLFGRRITRYLCIERSVPTQGQDILTDACIINERDAVPPGFTVVDYTLDTREKAVKKKVLCLRWMQPSLTNDAITELIFLAKGARRPPQSYTLVGELNGMSLCYKMGRIAHSHSEPNLQKEAALPYNAPTSTLNNMQALGSSLPYAMNPADRGAMATTEGSGHTNGPATSVSALSGVPWQLNPNLQMMTQLQNITIPEIRFKNLLDIENEYYYDFTLEKSTTNRMGTL